MTSKKLTQAACVLLIASLASGCGALQPLNVLSDAKCTTEIATKDSKFTCEFEGKKLMK